MENNNAVRSYQGTMPEISGSAYIDPHAVVIGDVTIGKQASVWPMAVIRGDVNYIRIGDKTNIQDGSVLHVSHQGPYRDQGGELIIGEGVTVGHKVMLHGCQIGNYCLLGMGAIILDDVVIPDYTIIGAGCLVPPSKKLESYSLYVGSPAKRVRGLTDEQINQLHYSAEHYVEVANKYI
jgi:carbonic anhydrase/acetyltransferase-like protein (isoleucine patch superfamily)